MALSLLLSELHWNASPERQHPDRRYLRACGLEENASNPETRVQSLREFVAVVRREVGAVAIDEDSIKRLWRFIVDLPDPGLGSK